MSPSEAAHDEIRDKVKGQLAAVRRELQTGRIRSPLAKLCTRMVSTVDARAAVAEAESKE